MDVCSGDMDSAKDRTRRFWGNMSDVADGVPLVGHVKGGIHLAVGDEEGGKKAIKVTTIRGLHIGDAQSYF